MLFVINSDWVIDTIKKLLSVHLFLFLSDRGTIYYRVVSIMWNMSYLAFYLKVHRNIFFFYSPYHVITLNYNNLSIKQWYHVKNYLFSVICTNVAVLSSLQWVFDGSVWKVRDELNNLNFFLAFEMNKGVKHFIEEPFKSLKMP